MATFTAILTPDFAGSNIRDTYSVNIPRREPLSLFDAKAAYVDLPFAGALAVRQPVEPLSIGRKGVLVGCFLDLDLGNKIIVFPSAIDAGNVVETRFYAVSLWNTYAVVKECYAITLTDGEGILVNGNAPPYFLGAYKDISYEIEVTANGPPIIAAFVYWMFDNGDAYGLLTVSGSRTVVFPYLPMYGFKEALEWKTDIMESFSGLESREAVRALPRQSFEWDIMMPDNSFNAFLRAWHVRAFALPMWHERRILKQDINIGDTVIYTDTAYSTFERDGAVIVWADALNYEVYQIEDFAGDIITVSKEALKALKAGSLVMPLKYGMSDQRYQQRQWGAMFKPTQLSFGWQMVDAPEITAARQPLQYLGYDVLQMPLSMDTAGFDESFTAPQLITDFEYGPVEYDSRFAYNKAGFSKVRFVLQGRANIWAFKQWLFYLCGRYNSFWVPSYRQEIELADNFNADTVNLQIKNIGYARYLKDLPICKYLYFETKGGKRLIRRIVNATAYTDNIEILVIDSSLGFAGRPEAFKYIAYLQLMRLSGDRVEFNWHNPDLAEVELTFEEIAVNG